MATQISQPPGDTNGSFISPNHETAYSNVQDHYGRAAESNDSEYGHAVAAAFGYSKEDLANAPKESNLGLSCGNPFALARLQEGDIVVDLGSGAGFDVFQAARKVGSSGKAIGVDMNKEMLSRAESIKQKTNADNASFVESQITAIDLPSTTADCIISNCVINLVPEAEKQLVFNEMCRLLKPKGRVAISDILLRKDLPDHLKNDMALYVGCIAGASRLEDYERYLKEANFEDILIIADESDLNVYKTASKEDIGVGCCSGGKGSSGGCGVKRKVDTKDLDLNEWAASYKIFAVKPDQ